MQNAPKILLATDFSEGSAAAERMAVDLARRLSASISVFHALEPLPYSQPNGTFYVPSPELAADARRAARALLHESEERIRAQGVVAESTLGEGVPYKEVARAAAEGGYDLVVIGTHGRTGLKHLLLGSVAERVVRLCERPVLTVRA
jgi:nucleotide-binding universal stress UspA family protein